MKNGKIEMKRVETRESRWHQFGCTICEQDIEEHSIVCEGECRGRLGETIRLRVCDECLAVGDIDWVLHIRAAVLEHWADYGSAPSWPPPDDPIEADARQRIVNKHVEEKSAVLLVHWADFLRGLTGKMQLPRSAVHEARERKGKSRFGDGWSSGEDYYEADEEANAA
jgi:hypothetical protein